MSNIKIDFVGVLVVVGACYVVKKMMVRKGIVTGNGDRFIEGYIPTMKDFGMTNGRSGYKVNNLGVPVDIIPQGTDVVPVGSK